MELQIDLDNNNEFDNLLGKKKMTSTIFAPSKYSSKFKTKKIPKFSLKPFTMGDFLKRERCEKQSQIGLSDVGKKSLFDKCMQGNPLSLKRNTPTEEPKIKTSTTGNVPSQQVAPQGTENKRKSNLWLYIGGGVVVIIVGTLIYQKYKK